MTERHQIIREIRRRLGVGYVDCCTALAATNGDLERAIALIRSRGAVYPTAVREAVRALNLSEGMPSKIRPD